MLLDLTLGMMIYLVVSLFFHEPFNFWGLVVAGFFAGFPDIDFLLFAILRRKYNLVSHRLIHLPLPLITLGIATICAFDWLFGSHLPFPIGYAVALFAIGNLSHFIHDSYGELGIKWLWPFNKTIYQIKEFRIINGDVEAEKHFRSLREGVKERSIWQEVIIRARMEPPGEQTISFFGLVFTLCALFYIFS